ncbi:uncharacterized protein SAMN04489835_0260 [Mycolicibacterium rutilum]|uniref:AAA+ ATPase domain-containing protein n=1 Tax=Mycolicibacterium rutilum TaxID=370526 RepID=A0A1H6IFS7_MYCRU|nr:uncharacterized protein SAMN04489835_0260 [Mycolicibacterium rutilum]
MTRAPTQRLLTPSKVTAWLDCPHYLTLTAEVDDGTRPKPEMTFGSFAKLLLDKGLTHEQECLAHYRQQGKSILEVPGKADGQTFSAWVETVGNPLFANHDVIYQMPFVNNGIRGVADFLVRVQDPVTGEINFEPVDAKLTRIEAKPGHVLQLCFYADAIEALTGRAPEKMHIWLGSGQLETLRVVDFQPYWRRLQGQLASALTDGAAGTVPEKCPHCEFCEFQPTCEAQWRDADSLIYVANIRKPDIAALVEADISTLTTLATGESPVVGLPADRLSRLRGQASLQLAARQLSDKRPPFELIESGDEPWGHGFEMLPEPDTGDVFLDFEGHPFWRADTGLFFLFGLIERNGEDCWRYRHWWAHDLGEEAAAVEQLVDYLIQRRERFPGMHVYHYNHTERSALQRLAETHGIAELLLAELIDTGAFVDLLLVARNSIQVGTESYGLKHLERLTDFERSHEIDKGAGAVLQYERFMTEHDQAALDAIAAYNEDDVRATLALRDWLVDHRPPGTPWRPAVTDPDQDLPELDETIARLHEFSIGTDHHNLGDLLCYWRDEWFAYLAPKKAKLVADPSDLFDDSEVIANLSPVGLIERTGKQGNSITPAMRFAFPPQDIDRFPRMGGKIMIAAPTGERLYPSIVKLDRNALTLDLLWGEKLQQAGYIPRVAVVHDWVDATVKFEALRAFAINFLENRDPSPVTLALLQRALPRLTDATVREAFVDDLDDMTDWVTRLDHSVVAVQGPPGTGKTYRAARLVRALVRAGKRIGITAVSHHAIANLLEAAVEALAESGEGDLLRAVCKDGAGQRNPLYGVTYTSDNARAARDEYNVVAGTTWLFSNPVMRDAPVDVLLVDEAGQLALADALAASGSAHNVVLFGDPLQLPQVAQGSHPGISGCSVLDHIVGEATLLPAERGVFLEETRRMHPDVCKFISQQIYEGQLHSHPDCEQQSTVAGTGLRWVRVDHVGNRTSSVEEADAVVEQLSLLMGSQWTNQKGDLKPLAPNDFMVVAPFNDQVNTIKARLAEHSHLTGVPVGTVDKFQGREAAVVFFSMATSSGEDLTRGVDFLFSRNRLNVAVSRARCLAYLVCTETLLDTRARTVEDMRLIATLNAFVEAAEEKRMLPEVEPD